MTHQTALQAAMGLTARQQVISLGAVSDGEQYLERSGAAGNNDGHQPAVTTRAGGGDGEIHRGEPRQAT
jgi:hypothetical protein